MTNFPTKGEDKKISLRNSNWKQFDRDFAERLKENHPDVWKAGGNIRGNEAFGLWGRALEGDDAKAVTDWIREREAWASRHRYDGKQFPEDKATKSNIAGVVASIKWGVILDIGEKTMKNAVNEVIENKRDDRHEKTNEMEQDKIKFTAQPERRFHANGTIELREADADTGERRVEGYASVFNSETNIGPFNEVVSPSAFEGRLNDPVVALFNHNQLQPLAKVGAGLELSVDDYGLRYSFPIPDTTAGRDLVELMERGIVRDASFAFMLGPDGDTWEKRDGENDLRTINRVARLVDVSVVTIGAYSDASSVLRSYDAFSAPQRDVCGECDCSPSECKENPQDSPETAPSDKIQTHGARIRSAVIQHRIKQIRKKS